MKKPLVSYLLVLVLLLGLFAPAAAMAEEPVKLTAIASLHTSTLDLETLPIYQEIEEISNVDIEWEYYRADWDTKKQLILASGDLPDIFFGRSTLTTTDIQLNLDSFIPLDDLIEEHAPNIRKMFEEYPDTRTINKFPDGKIYSLPHVMSGRPAIMGSLFINAAWLEKLGLAMPTTIAELDEVARAFVTQDPNGNGEADEIGYEWSSLLSTNFGAREFWGAFGIHDSLDSYLALDENKNVIYNPATEGYKNWVAWLSNLYAEGLMDREVLTHDFAQYKAKSRRSEMEITGIQCGWDIGQMGNPNYGMLLPVAGPNGDNYHSANSVMNKMGTTYATFSITTACKDPVAAIKWIDHFYSDEYGLQAYLGAYDVCLVKNEDGTISRIFPEGQSMDNWSWTNAMVDNFVGYVSSDVESKIVYDDEWSLKGLSKLDFDKAYAPYLDESYNYPPVILEFEAAEEASVIKADLESITNTFTAAWVSEGGVENGWEDYQKELERAGLSRYLEIYQEAYNNYIAE